MAAVFVSFYIFSSFTNTIQAITYDCRASECNKLFIFPETTDEIVTIDCHNAGDCDRLTIYSASTTLIVNCLGTNSCNGTSVYCGDFDPPNALYSVSDMDGSGVYCHMHCDADPAPGCIHSLLSCKGSGIASCSINSYPDATPDPIDNIESTTLECNVNPSSSCYMDCEDSFCANSNLLCHNAVGMTGCDCFGEWCSGVTETYAVTYAPITNIPSVVPTETETPTQATLITADRSTTYNPTSASAVTTANVWTPEPTARNATLVISYKATRRPTTVNEGEVIENTDSHSTEGSYKEVSSQNIGDYAWVVWIGIGAVTVIIAIAIVCCVRKQNTSEQHGRALGKSVDIAIIDAPESITSGNATQKGSQLLMTELKPSKVETDDSGLDESDSGENEGLYSGSKEQCVTTGGNTTEGDAVHEEFEEDIDMNENEGEGSDHDDDIDAMYVKSNKSTTSK